MCIVLIENWGKVYCCLKTFKIIIILQIWKNSDVKETAMKAFRATSLNEQNWHIFFLIQN